MSYIAFDLDALNAAPNVARAARVSEDAIIGGLLRLWAHAFRTRADMLDELEVRGCFDTPADVVPALKAFGFLAEADGKRLRVRGAERYLRVTEQRQKAGEARARSAGRSAGRFTSESPADHQRPPADDQHTTSESPALTPSTEHRTPNTKEEEAPPPLTVVEKAPAFFVEPTTPPDTWTGEDFFAWAQSLRQKAGLVGERRRPRDLGAWWSTCLMTPGVTAARMQNAFLAFGDSKHWQSRTPALPFAGFVSQWDQFLGREVRHAS